MAEKRVRTDGATAGPDEPPAKRLRTEPVDSRENQFAPVGIVAGRQMMPCHSDPWVLWDFICNQRTHSHIVCRTMDGKRDLFLSELADSPSSRHDRVVLKRDQDRKIQILHEDGVWPYTMDVSQMHASLDTLVGDRTELRRLVVAANPFHLWTPGMSAAGASFPIYLWEANGRWTLAHWSHRTPPEKETPVFEIVPSDQDWLSFGVDIPLDRLVAVVDEGSGRCLPSVLLKMIASEYCVLLMSRKLPPASVLTA